MKMFGKRGTSTPKGPEESYASDAEWYVPEPAPPGTLHPGAAPAPPVASDAPRPSSRKNQSYRLRVGVPGTTAGRVALAAGVLFVLGVVGVAFAAARYSVLHDSNFVLAASSEIQLEGNRHLTRPQVVSVFASDLQRNIFRVPLAERQADLERLPWVEHATVMRLLPDHVRVQVMERRPVAFVRQGTQIGLVDGSGVLLDMPQDVAGDPNYSFPVLTGLSAKDPLPVRAARMESYKRFMSELDSTGEKFTKSLSEVDVSNPEDVKALIASGGTDLLVHFGDENFLQRYRVFQQNLPAWKAQYPRLAAVDTRYEHQLVLEMQPGAAVPLAGDNNTNAGPSAPKPKPAGKAAPATVAKSGARPPAKPQAGAKPSAAPAHKPAPLHASASSPADDNGVVNP